MKQHDLLNRFFSGEGILLTALLGLLVLTGCAQDQTQFLGKDAAETVSLVSSEVGDATPQESADIYVYVCGAVEQEGVYTLREDARVFEAVEAAGGFTEDAATDSINQARKLTDGEELYVPTREEVLSGDAASTEASASGKDSKDDKVNINTADAQELTTLTGIGETRAQAIILWREENGGFSSIEDLKNVDGIGDKSYEKIKDRITVN